MGAGAQEIQVEKLKDNLFLLRGGGGNTAVFVAGDGVTVVDTKIPGWGQPLIAKIKEIRITGNKAFSESTLLGQFDLDTGGWLSWYTKSDRYSRAKLNADLETLRRGPGKRGRDPDRLHVAADGRARRDRRLDEPALFQRTH